MEYLIQQFLKENNLEGINGIDYTLRNDGDGVYIEKWNFLIKKPIFTQTDLDLIEFKNTKISQLKNNRNNKLLKPMQCIKSFEIVFDDQGLDFITDNEVFFEFRVTSTGQPATEPNSLLLNAINKTGDKYIRYSCIIIEGENSRKGYIQLNSVVANNLLSHIEQRNTNYIKLSNDLEIKINECLTLQEVENIDVDFNKN